MVEQLRDPFCFTLPNFILVLQQNRLRWYGHVLRKEDNDWVKKCMEYEVEGPRPRRRPKRTWREVVREDCQARKLNTEDAMEEVDKRMSDNQDGCEWVSFFWYRPTRVVPDQRPLNGCVRVCVTKFRKDRSNYCRDIRRFLSFS